MRAVDTNVLVRILARDDPKQVRVADEFVSAGAWVSLLALAETTWVLTTVYERDATEVGASVEQLLNHKDLILQDREVVAAALETFRSRPALGFTDCLLLEVARKAGHLPLGTFDRNLSKIDGAEKL
ncbi:MAG: PIN domain-containing protein [Acidobacteria bacterium RIFCSPLOWO2_02_FULL_65_29]|nr:MAG: PIN domain-containing protein [Acidobacteria bacterium RIFCSPLOWO2_02_FULL_65_29]